MEKIIKIFVSIIFSLLIFSSCDSNTYFDPTKNLVVYYTFDGNYEDSSGNELHLTSSNTSLTEDKNGDLQKAVEFNGTSDSYLSIVHDSMLNLSSSFTITFWINPLNTNDFYTILSKGRDMDNSYIINQDGKTLQFLLTSERGIYQSVAENTSISQGEWSFVSCVNDKERGKMIVYVNNILEAEKQYFPFQATNVFPLVIGRHFTSRDGSGGYDYAYSGQLDDLRIYNKALTSGEISDLYKYGVGLGSPDSNCYPSSTCNPGLVCVSGLCQTDQ